MMLHEKYRPKALSDVVGQAKAVAQIQSILDRGGFGGRALWLTGPSGTGKTTLARIVASSMADDFNVVEFDSGDDIDAEAMDLIDDATRYCGMGRPGRAIIINEAHRLNARQIARFLGLLERIPEHVVFIFTTTKDGEEKLFDDQIDASPLLGRCIQIRTTGQGFAKPMAERLAAIARAEGWKEKPLAWFVGVMQDSKNSARMALSTLEGGALA